MMKRKRKRMDGTVQCRRRFAVHNAQKNQRSICANLPQLPYPMSAKRPHKSDKRNVKKDGAGESLRWEDNYIILSRPVCFCDGNLP